VEINGEIGDEEIERHVKKKVVNDLR